VGDDLLEGLNPAQRRAVAHSRGPLLVLAGAGSGKTRVLTHRIARLIRDEGVAPWRVLAITFTNRAAGEMRERLRTLTGEAGADIWAGTFHSTCVRILRRDAAGVGYERGFSIYDDGDQQRMIRACSDDEEVDAKRFPPRAVLGRISDAKNRLLDPDAFAAETESFFDDTVARVYRRYHDRMRAAQAMDFDDLLMLGVTLLERDEGARARWAGRFEHVLVDEYQDTNHAQYRLVRVLAAPQDNVMVVGDDDQGIYSWRGADSRNILGFERDYPDATVVTLEQNYRSTQTILSAANAVVARNHARRPKNLWTDRGAGDPIVVAALADEYEEGRFVLGEIERALAGGLSRGDVAVFYRTHAQSRVVEDTLVRSGIPYQVIGGPRFYERAEVRDLLAWLRAAVNGDDEVGFARLVAAPRRGVGPGCVQRVRDFAAGSGVTLAHAALDADRVPGLQRGQRRALRDAGAVLAEIAHGAASGTPVDELVERALEGSGLRAALEAEDTIESRGRLENLEELVRVAAEHQARAEEPGLAAFLEEVALYADADDIADDEGRVTLMTLHNAKGLEFDTVLITGMEEGLFPHARSDTPEALEEERRLCYVGLTRARRRLVLTHPHSRAMRGGRDYRVPSRFLGELPVELLGASPGIPRPAAPARTSVARPAAPPLRTGDTVVHATFGEGVVTAVEQGGDLVHVRFSDRNRCLVAERAPMRKVAVG
jgi:DNA helicase-2/ATP-dependent DNA helicase PcrA